MADYETFDWDDLASDLESTVDAAWEQLKALQDEQLESRTHAGAWSVKEVVGHLIDSAANNHQRFVRLQIADMLVFPNYSQDNDAWVAIQGYQETSPEELFSLWRHFNRHLARLMRSVDQGCLGHRWSIDAHTTVSLGELMVDYVRHLKGHLKEIRDRL